MSSCQPVFLLRLFLAALFMLPAGAGALPEWSGYWVFVNDPDNSSIPRGAALTEADLPSWTPEYAAKWQIIRDASAAGSFEYDPGAKCLPPGMPFNMTIPYSGEIHMRPGQVTIITEWAGDTRRIYTDGRSHPHDLDPTRQGHSIGKWQGDTLVADTVGIVADTQLNGILSPHSDQLHITEWFHEYKPGFLEIRYRLEDPKAFTKPYEYKLTWKRSPIKNHEISEYICTNNREGTPATADQPAAGKSK